MPEQLALDLPCKTAFGVEDYFVSSANEMVSGLIGEWQSWPLKKLLILGPKGAGKTHVARIWAEKSGANFIDVGGIGDFAEQGADNPAVVENLELLPREQEEALFHLLNKFDQAGQYLVLTGRGAIGGWGIHLPDLESRLRQITQVQIKEPDDNLLLAVLIKQFQDRGLSPLPSVISYIQARMPRSFEAIANIVAELDRRSLQEGGRVTQKLARTLLEEL